MNATEMAKLLRDLGACSPARDWAKGKTLEQIWITCERADWLLWLIGKMCGKKGWPDRKAIVLVACDCAELALPYVEIGDNRPRCAIETARKWVRGDATIDEVKIAANAAANAAAYAAAYAAYAAAYVAYAAAYAAADAARSAVDAAYADFAATDAASKEIRDKVLTIVREKLTPDCLKALKEKEHNL